jgi:5'-nucleotidase
LSRGNTSFFCHSLTAVFLHFLIGENLQNHIGVDNEDITSWNIAQFYPKVSVDEIYLPVLNPSLAPKMTPEKDSIRYTSEWVSRGHTVLVATATDIETSLAKTQWLKMHYPWFTPKYLIITQRKQLIKGDILIDDGVHNLLQDKETGIEPLYKRVCFDRPWNRSFDCELHGIQRVRSFEEIDKVIKEIENSKGA